MVSFGVAVNWTRWGQRLKQLRVKHRWSQRELAAKVGTSRNTINRWETGARRPSIKMVEQLARALKMSATALLGSEGAMAVVADSTAPAIRIRFDVRALFPDDQDHTVPLIQLMLATDDVRHLQKVLITTLHNDASANESERAIAEGELGHSFRLMCGHLCEALEAFANLDKDCASVLGAAAIDARATEALARVRRAWNVIRSGRRTKNRSFIDVVRNKVGFHYDPQRLKSALDKHRRTGPLKGSLVLSFSGLGRYEVTDDLVKLVILNEMGWDIREFRQKFAQEMGEAISLVGALGDVVDYLMRYLLAPHLKNIEQENEVIRIDPRIASGKERAERGRRAHD